MKKNLNEKAVRLELVKVNQSRFSAEVLSGNARVNLTQMAQPFGKSCKPTFWLRTEEAQRYLQAIARLQKCNLADLIEVRNGGVPGTNGRKRQGRPVAKGRKRHKPAWNDTAWG